MASKGYVGVRIPTRQAKKNLSTFDPLFSANKDNSSLNVLRVQKYLNNSRMKELARDNMPFMGLEIHGLAEAK